MRFSQVDVFSAEPGLGNPVAVVHDAEGVSAEQMARFSAWTNLSEVTFLLPPTPNGAAGGADYRVRIWCRDRELPFAGHPTLGSAHAWLEAGGTTARPDAVVQECAAGLIVVRRAAGEGGRERLAFAAPPQIRSGPPTDAELEAACRALRIARPDVVAARWIDNGPGWLGLWLASAEEVLAIEPDYLAMAGMDLGVAGPWGSQAAEVGADIEVRGLDPVIGEDPVTGSLNASLGQWLIGEGILPARYVAAQGTRLGRRGRVFVEAVAGAGAGEVGGAGEVWVGGDTTTVISGTVVL